jgi:probable F420-dependent oxidoreductase
VTERVTTVGHPPVAFGTSMGDAASTAAWARRVEELGYDVLACGEHLAFHGPVTNSLVSLACAAGATRHIRLMSSIVLLPLYPAALAAKLAAMVDVTSGGRYLFGVGIGGEFPKEFEAVGVPVAERAARTDEALEVIKRLWTERDVEFHGRFNDFSGVTLAPPPIQRPHPPIWVAGRKEGAMRRAARHGDGWLPYMYTPEQLHDSLTRVRAHAEEIGRDPSAIAAGLFAWSAVDEDGDRARRWAIETLGNTYQQDFSKLASRYAVSGDPEQCRARLREYIDAGATLVVLAPACRDDERRASSVELMAKAVLPALRADRRDAAT